VGTVDSTATTQSHIDTVRSVYEAFGSGDIPAILELVSEDVHWDDWADSFAQRAGVPWLEPRTGRGGVADFFRIVGHLQVAEFSVLDIMAGDKQVVAEIVIDATTPAGGRYRDEELHLWSFDAAGKINRMRHYVDTAKHIAAAGHADTTA